MGSVVFGIILLVAAVVLARFHTETRPELNLRPWAWAARIIGILLIVIGVIGSSIVIVPAGYQAVLMQFGAVKGSMSEGIHLIVPYVNTVQLMEMRTQKKESNASAASKDLQMVSTQLALNFHVDPGRVAHLYRNVGVHYRERIIDPAVQESIKMVTAQYTAEQLIKNRAAVKAQVEADITSRLGKYDIVVEPAGLSITNFNFGPEFNAAIEAKQVAQQETEKQRYILQKAELERQTAVTQARGKSEAARLNASALQALGGSKVLAREWIDKWDGHVPTVSGGAGGGIIIDINSLLKQP